MIRVEDIVKIVKQAGSIKGDPTGKNLKIEYDSNGKSWPKKGGLPFGRNIEGLNTLCHPV